MRNLAILVCLTLILFTPILAVRYVPELLAYVSDDHAVKQSQNGVVRRAREGLHMLRTRHGSPTPDVSWGEVDQAIYHNLVDALRREGEQP